MIFRPENLLVDFTGDEKAFEGLQFLYQLHRPVQIRVKRLCADLQRRKIPLRILHIDVIIACNRNLPCRQVDFIAQLRIRILRRIHMAEYILKEEYMLGAGHSVATARALSYGDVRHAINEELSGMSLYRLTSALEKEFDDKKELLAERLETLCKMIFRPENLLVGASSESLVLYPRLVC
mgnify:CR=1 FL=1